MPDSRHLVRAANRTQANHRLVALVGAEVGRQVTVREANAHRAAKVRGEPSPLSRDVEPRGGRRPGRPRVDELSPEERAAIAVPGSEHFLTHDRVVEFDPEDCRRIGQLLAKVNDFKVYTPSSTVVLNLTTTMDHLGTVMDAARLSRGHPLLVTLDELFPPGLPDVPLDASDVDDEWVTG